mmetsp:Transcript_17870/g.49560  ORF Transcript_17870/g.49560 Transcript_17870/m.49560 type:complete len:338 (-) Transcript_17870:404-1417(-)
MMKPNSNEDDLDSVEVSPPPQNHIGENRPSGQGYPPATPTSEWYYTQQRDDSTINVAGTEVANAQVPMMAQFCCAILVLVAITTGFDKHETSNYSYAVAASIIAMIFSLAGIVFAATPGLGGQMLFSAPILGSVSVGYLNALFLFVWWLVAACVLTFDHPFLITGNGYFASWAGFVFSIMGCGVSASAVRSTLSGVGPLLGLVGASVILIIATPEEIGSNHEHNSEAVYALILGIFTPLLVLVILNVGDTTSTVGPMKLPILVILSILWVVMASLVTFRGPFKDTGNGYFAAWAGAGMCLLATHQTRVTANANDMTQIRQTNSTDTADTAEDDVVRV